MVRFKTRWIGFDVKSTSDKLIIRTAELHNTITDSIKENFGDLGLGKTTRRLQLESIDDYSFILQCPSEYVDVVLVSLFFLTEVNRKPVKIEVQHVGGTILSTRKRLRDRWKT